MLKSPLLWVAALWVGVMIHVDWHLGRAGDDGRSFDLTYHWLLAFPTFIPVAWLTVRKWAASAISAALTILSVGVVIGQGIEPLGETIHFHAGADPFTSVERWRIFAEFTAAGLIVLVACVVAVRWYRTRALRSGAVGSIA